MSWRERPALPAHWPELVRLLAEQNPSAGCRCRALDCAGQRRGSGGHRAAGGAVRRAAVYAFQGGHGTGSRESRPRRQDIPTRPSSGWPRKTTTLPRSTMSSFRRGASCASWFTRRRPTARAAGGRHGAGRLDYTAGGAGGGAAGRLRSHGGAGRGLQAGPHPGPGLRGVLLPRSLPRRGCWCWMRAGASCIAWARRCCARLWSTPTSCIARCWSGIRSWRPPAITRRWPWRRSPACCS